MKMKDLRGLSMPDLRKKLKDSRQELFNLRFQMATGQLQNHRQIRHVRRDLAQILTEIHLKEADGGDAVQTAMAEEGSQPGVIKREQRKRSRAAATQEKA
jgi:large subunit ribosomal protein L29